MRLNCFILLSYAFFSCNSKTSTLKTDVLVIGGGTGGTAAGIAASRMGVQVLLTEPGPWLGGMISAAGVTCADGNHNMPSGIWNEFRERIYAVYGGPQAVATGWVSHTQFEPHVSDSIWKVLVAAEPTLKVLHGWNFSKVVVTNGKVSGAFFTNAVGETLTVHATITIDATELGDVMANAGVPYSLGMEAGTEVDENVGVLETNDIVQDLTWVATLKDYGQAADCTIAKPTGYAPLEFDGVCTEYYHNKDLKAPNVNAKKMLDYGRLPNGKYMINWPNSGNDTYLNVVELAPAEREKELEKAKQTTLRFVYFIQHELGFKHLGLANDEYPTADRLALMPYHREGRRLKGMVRMNIHHIAEPHTYNAPLYRTGISVGDYPIDHHHKKNQAAPQHLEFYSVPSYNIPLGALIPQQETGLIVAEKGISVSNVVNGTTRLQPVVMLTGQAAGVLAALCVQQGKPPQQLSVRDVQAALLAQKAYIMPYYDVKPNDMHFDVMQRIGATGLLQGKGEPFQWSNRTWYYPDSLANGADLALQLQKMAGKAFAYNGKALTVKNAAELIFAAMQSIPDLPNPENFTNTSGLIDHVGRQWPTWGLKAFDLSRPITRREISVLLDKTLDPFNHIPVDHYGKFKLSGS